ncbi:MAG: hypothetical protein HRU78_07950 [Gammaproteobacteria bacterium]|nr:MAG: hypothetical protein HRU78_07950 [Gammaproteobacteria bacterium]
MRKEIAVKHINEDLTFDPKLRQACLDIVDFLCLQPEQALRHITFGTLSGVAQLTNTEDLVAASRYLSGSRLPLLNLEFEFIDLDDVIHISHEVITEAKATGIFYHPETGELIEEFEKMIYMYFELSSEGMELNRSSSIN